MAQHNSSSKTVVVHIRVPSETKDVLEGLAAKDHRTLTSMVNKIIAEYLEQFKVTQDGGSDASEA
jgi:predicted DNA-binding protein